MLDPEQAFIAELRQLGVQTDVYFGASPTHNLFKCPSCLNPYDKSRPSLLIKCGHLLCESCYLSSKGKCKVCSKISALNTQSLSTVLECMEKYQSKTYKRYTFVIRIPAPGDQQGQIRVVPDYYSLEDLLFRCEKAVNLLKSQKQSIHIVSGGRGRRYADIKKMTITELQKEKIFTFKENEENTIHLLKPLLGD